MGFFSATSGWTLFPSPPLLPSNKLCFSIGVVGQFTVHVVINMVGVKSSIMLFISYLSFYSLFLLFLCLILINGYLFYEVIIKRRNGNEIHKNG